MPFTTLAETSAYRKGREKNVLLRSIVVAALSFMAVTIICIFIAILKNPIFTQLP